VTQPAACLYRVGTVEYPRLGTLAAARTQETKPRRGSSGGARNKSDLHRVVDFILSKSYDPGIIFCFSRQAARTRMSTHARMRALAECSQECEDNAALLAQKMSLIDETSANEARLRRDGARPCHVCAGTGLVRCHVCTGTGLTAAMSVPGLTGLSAGGASVVGGCHARGSTLPAARRWVPNVLGHW
jgi:hypothetical protein